MKNEISNIPDHFYRVSIKALILDKEKRFLLMLENNDMWELPGGGLDFGEKPQICLAREIKEEMGLNIVSISNEPSYFFTALHRSGKWWICNVVYEVIVENFNFTRSDECIELRFFTKEDALKENLFSNVVEFVNLYNPDDHEPKTNSV